MTTAHSPATSSRPRRSLRWPVRAFAVAAVSIGSVVGLSGLAGAMTTTPSPAVTLSWMQALNNLESQAFGNQPTVVNQPALINMNNLMQTTFQQQLNTSNSATIAAQVSTTQSKLTSNIQAMNQAVQTSTFQTAQGIAQTAASRSARAAAFQAQFRG